MTLLNDNETTLSVLREAVSGFVRERKWERFHNPKNLAESICIEASELLEVFQWFTTDESKAFSKNPANVKRLSEELADVIVYCLALANAVQIDISNSVASKLKDNSRRYPIARCKEVVPYRRKHGGRKT